MNAKQAIESSARRAAEEIGGYIQCTDDWRKGIIEREFDWVEGLIEAARRIDDPEDEGFCPSCGGDQLPLDKVIKRTENGGEYPAYLWRHNDGCWYGDLRRALSAIPQGEKERADVSL